MANFIVGSTRAVTRHDWPKLDPFATYHGVMSPRPKRELAREHLETARGHVERQAEGDAVNALFYAAEAAVDGLASAHSVDTKKMHNLKADAATKLHEQGILDRDYAPLLRRLNQARKDIWYEGDEPDFGDRSLDDVLAEVETLVGAVEELA